MIKNEKAIDIHERIYKFVIRVINLTKALPKNQHNEILVNQIVRSVTSVGANDQEADGAESRKDFIAKYSIVKKELKETNYWLRVIADTNREFIDRMEAIKKEGNELVLIISSIIINTKNRI